MKRLSCAPAGLDSHSTCLPPAADLWGRRYPVTTASVTAGCGGSGSDWVERLLQFEHQALAGVLTPQRSHTTSSAPIPIAATTAMPPNSKRRKRPS